MEGPSLHDRHDFLDLAEEYDPFLPEKIRRLPTGAQKQVVASIDPIPKTANATYKRVLINEVRTRVEAAMGVPVLRSRFDSAFTDISGARFYAPEDSKVALEAATAAVKRCQAEGSEPVTLVDLCTGNGVIPFQLWLEKEISGFWACDLEPETAIEVRQDLARRRADLAHLLRRKTRIVRMDILRQNPKAVAGSVKLPPSRRVLSANPPWVPTPKNPVPAGPGTVRRRRRPEVHPPDIRMGRSFKM